MFKRLNQLHVQTQSKKPRQIGWIAVENTRPLVLTIIGQNFEKNDIFYCSLKLHEFDVDFCADSEYVFGFPI